MCLPFRYVGRLWKNFTSTDHEPRTSPSECERRNPLILSAGRVGQKPFNYTINPKPQTTRKQITSVKSQGADIELREGGPRSGIYLNGSLKFRVLGLRATVFRAKVEAVEYGYAGKNFKKVCLGFVLHRSHSFADSTLVVCHVPLSLEGPSSEACSTRACVCFSVCVCGNTNGISTCLFAACAAEPVVDPKPCKP